MDTKKIIPVIVMDLFVLSFKCMFVLAVLVKFKPTRVFYNVL